MRLCRTLAPTLLAFAVCLVGTLPVFGQAKTSDLVVKAAATADKAGADGKQVVTVTLDVDPKFHIYANPVGNPDFESSQTSLSLKGKGELVKVEYPAGEVKKDATVGDYKVLKGKVAIKVTVQRAKDAGPLELALKVQACNDKVCYLPATIKVNVP